MIIRFIEYLAKCSFHFFFKLSSKNNRKLKFFLNKIINKKNQKKSIYLLNKNNLISNLVENSQNYEYVLISSFYNLNLKNIFESPNDFIRLLINNNFNNLFFPTNPIINSKNDNFVFNINSTRVSTGELGRCSINYSNSLRSVVPFSNLNYIGNNISNLMKYNIPRNIKFVHGKNTFWDFLYRNNALWIGIDVDVANSFTPIHILEDFGIQQYKYNKWYLDKTYSLKGNNEKFLIKVRNKNTKLNYLSYSLNRYLEKNHLINKKIIGDMTINYLNIRKIIDNLSKNEYKPFLGILL